MRIAVASDHAGFPLKETVIEAAREADVEVLDLGTDGPQRVDYPDYAEKAIYALQSGQIERAVLICGSGVGMCIAANKFKGINASVCHDIYSAHQGVEHDNMNVLCLGSLIVGKELAKELVRAFLAAQYSTEERFHKRVDKIRRIEARGVARPDPFA
jgi:ribose 5-phosphate isomerase B